MAADSKYVPWTPDQVRNPSIRHLQAAADEYARRFHFHSVDDEEQITAVENLESPFMLVATNVRDDWKVPNDFQNIHAVRFMLVQGETKNKATLFINCMAESMHGIFDGDIHFDIDLWIGNNGLEGVLCPVISGGGKYQPDRAYQPRRPVGTTQEGMQMPDAMDVRMVGL